MSQPDLPIFDLAPRLRARTFLPIAKRPTPVQPLHAFGERVFVKRDDLVSDLYGGNKVRRWEWLLGRAKDRGVETLVTVGGTGSTQVTSLCAHGRQADFEVVGVLFDQPWSPFVDEALELDQRFGGTILHGGGYARTALLTLQQVATRKRAMLVPPGASGPLANLAYVDALLELAEQVDRKELPRPDRIVVACGSGGTTVGLAVGAAMLGWPTIVVGVRITELVASNPLTLAALTRATESLLRKEGFRSTRRAGLWNEARPQMDHRFVGAGYGHSTPAAAREALRFQSLFGAPGEVTYSGKALAALATIAAEHPRENILLWNTLSSTGRSRG